MVIRFFISITLPLMLVIYSCEGEHRDKPTDLDNPRTLYTSFDAWVKDAPYLSIMKDTLTSFEKIETQNYTSVINDVDNFYGILFNEKNDDQVINYYMINSYLIDSIEILYLEVFNSSGKRISSRSLFDYSFFNNEDKFSRFYINGHSFVFENYKMINGILVEVTKKEINAFDMSELY